MTLLIMLITVLMSGCITLDTHHHAAELAQKAGLTKSIFTANAFNLTAYSRITDLNQPINVYIEGDGLAWISRHQPSSDPTPRLAIGLALAASDTSKNVVYLARPCQFNDFNQVSCDSAYWLNQRFSEKVIDAMSQELDTYVGKTHGQRVNLIGYSGGAAVAVLLAVRRHDIVSLRTVAGNLDHVYVNQYHQVDLMPESLNAIDVAQKISDLPQVHFVGTQDKVIPKEVVLRFIRQQRSVDCVSLLEVQAGHQDNWIKSWQELLLTPLPCSK